MTLAFEENANSSATRGITLFSNWQGVAVSLASSVLLLPGKKRPWREFVIARKDRADDEVLLFVPRAAPCSTCAILAMMALFLSFSSFSFGALPCPPRLLAAAVLLFFPTLSLAYAVSAALFLRLWGESSSHVNNREGRSYPPLLAQVVGLWIAALAAALAAAGGTALRQQPAASQATTSIQTWPAAAAAFFLASVYFLRKVRTDVVEGGPPPPPPRLAPGKVFVVTGCNQGIGKETLRLLFSGGGGGGGGSGPPPSPPPPSSSPPPRHTVILCCRSLRKAREAAADVGLPQPDDQGESAGGAGEAAATTATATSATSTTTRIPRPPRVDAVEMDLSNLSQVRRGARAILAKHPVVHVLVNNAGLMMDKQALVDPFDDGGGGGGGIDDDERGESDDCASTSTSSGSVMDGDPKKSPSHTRKHPKYELVMTANHLGHYLLTRLLKPTDCVVNVSSCTYALADPGFASDPFCLDRRRYSMFGQYAASKAANLLFTAELSRRGLGRRGGARAAAPACHAVHPGLVRTDVVRNMPWYLRLPNRAFGFLVGLYQKTPAQGAWNTVHAVNETYRSRSDSCENNGGAGGNGTARGTWTYWVNRKPHAVLPWILDEDTGRKLWDMSADLVGLPSSDDDDEDDVGGPDPAAAGDDDHAAAKGNAVQLRR
jgi:NAD(P)-dependent dehydrogenase (short-subunit alcohol dehydrogenase family)